MNDNSTNTEPADNNSNDSQSISSAASESADKAKSPPIESGNASSSSVSTIEADIDNKESNTSSSNKRPPKKNIKILVATLCFISLASVSSYFYYHEKQLSMLIYKGVSVNNIDLSLLDADSAFNLLDSSLNKYISNKRISIISNSKRFEFTFDRINARYDLSSAVKVALEYGKEDNIIHQVLSKYRISKYSSNLMANLKYDSDALISIINEACGNFNTLPKNAEIKIIDGKPVLTPGISAFVVDKDKLKSLIDIALTKFDGTDLVVNFDTEIKKPELSDEILSKITSKIASYQTNLTSNYSRTQNIKIASGYLDGNIILPGETFSMNKALGPRTRARGYLDAPIFKNGEVVPDLAGGICQVVSTLYNAVLLTDMEIVERKPHSLAVTYVPFGQDATIAGDVIDFKFKNNKDFPLYIQSYVGGGKLNINLFGSPYTSNFKISSSYSRTSSGGVYASVYKDVYDGDKLVKRILISKDAYKPH